jgi:hypothetical protein
MSMVKAAVFPVPDWLWPMRFWMLGVSYKS